VANDIRIVKANGREGCPGSQREAEKDRGLDVGVLTLSVSRHLCRMKVCQALGRIVE